MAFHVKGVLFDLDGTLVNTVAGLTQLVNQMRKDFDKPPISEEKVGKYIGKGMLVLVRRALTNSMDAELDPQIFEMAVKSFASHVEKGEYDKGTLYPGVIEMLRELRRRGLKIALVTNKPYNMTVEVLEQSELTGMFDTVIGGDTTENPKPAADPLLLACERLGIKTDEAIMVGDSGNDSLAAKNAGIPSILLRSGWSEGVPIDSFAKRDGALYVLREIRELPDHLC